MKHLLIVCLALILAGCAGTFTSTVTPGYTAPAGGDIAISYLDHADLNISNKATQVFTRQLTQCGIFNFMTADQTEDLLQKK